MASSSGAWTRRNTSGGYEGAGTGPRTCPRVFLGCAATLAGFFFVPFPLAAEDRFRAEIFGGTAWSAPTTLTIDQSGEERLSFRAHWETRPLDEAPYYAVRVGLWNRRRGWELQLLHHKVYLTNGPPEIERFEVSHGWTLLTLQRATRGRPFDWRLGVGAVIGYPEGRIRGEPANPEDGIFGSGYYLSGAGALAGAGRTFTITRRFFASTEAQLTYSWASVPIAKGHARTANFALHVLLGLGISR